MPEDIVGRVLRLVGYEAHEWQFDETASVLTIWVRQAGSRPFYTCSGCGIGSERVHSAREWRVRDLPWGTWKVTLVLEVHRVYCRRCGVRGERIEFLEDKHPYTRRFAAAVARDCEDAAVRRVAAKWGLSAQTVRRIDKRSLRAWAACRRRRPLRWMGVDEIFWGKGKCLTVVSDLAVAEPIWAGPERNLLPQGADRAALELQLRGGGDPLPRPLGQEPALAAAASLSEARPHTPRTPRGAPGLLQAQGALWRRRSHQRQPAQPHPPSPRLPGSRVPDPQSPAQHGSGRPPRSCGMSPTGMTLPLNPRILARTEKGEGASLLTPRPPPQLHLGPTRPWSRHRDSTEDGRSRQHPDDREVRQEGGGGEEEGGGTAPCAVWGVRLADQEHHLALPLRRSGRPTWKG